jgi:TetR/AcrR family fatty acid metabolism transcriptional regulator
VLELADALAELPARARVVERPREGAFRHAEIDHRHDGAFEAHGHTRIAFSQFPGRLMPAISPQRMRDRYDAILAAATRVFAEKGYSSASITDIAQAADISDGLIYKYFENKRDLLENVLKSFYERIIADLESKVAKGKTFEERLYVLVSEHLHVFVADLDLCRLFISEVRTASDYRGSAIQQLNRRYTSILIKIVDEGIADGEIRSDIDPRLVRDMLFGAIEHSSWRHINGSKPLDVPRVARSMTDVLVNGLAVRGRRKRS